MESHCRQCGYVNMSDTVETISDDLSVCEGCDGSGIRVPAEPGCRIPVLDSLDWVIVEKCDTCDQYTDDLGAASTLFEEVVRVQCLAGGWHVACRKGKFGVVS